MPTATVRHMESPQNPDLQPQMVAAQEAIDAVTTDYLGADVALVMERLQQEFASRGIDLTDDEWLRKNCAEPIANGQPLIVVEDVENFENGAR